MKKLFRVLLPIFDRIRPYRDVKGRFPNVSFICRRFWSATAIPVLLNDEKLPLSINSREHLKYAALMSVNAATTHLTTALFLLEMLSKSYQELITRLTGIMDECVLLDGWSEELWQSVIEYRNELETVKTEITFLTGHMEAVDKLVTAAVELTFNVESEYLCATLCERSHNAKERLAVLQKEMYILEEGYLLAQANVAKYKNSDEH